MSRAPSSIVCQTDKQTNKQTDQQNQKPGIWGQTPDCENKKTKEQTPGIWGQTPDWENQKTHKKKTINLRSGNQVFL